MERNWETLIQGTYLIRFSLLEAGDDFADVRTTSLFSVVTDDVIVDVDVDINTDVVVSVDTNVVESLESASSVSTLLSPTPPSLLSNRTFLSRFLFLAASMIDWRTWKPHVP